MKFMRSSNTRPSGVTGLAPWSKTGLVHPMGRWALPKGITGRNRPERGRCRCNRPPLLYEEAMRNNG